MIAQPRYYMKDGLEVQAAIGFLHFEIGFVLKKTILPKRPWIATYSYWGIFDKSRAGL